MYTCYLNLIIGTIDQSLFPASMKIAESSFLPVLIASTFLFTTVSCNNPDKPKAAFTGWPAYAGSKAGIRYSGNEEINTSNVGKLQVAWTYSSHDKDTGDRSQIQCNPIVINQTLYGVSPQLKLFALDAATGIEKWKFDPASEDTAAARIPNAFFQVSRGVIYWADEQGKNGRIFYGAGSKIYAIDINDGRPVRTFGTNGRIDFADHTGRETGTYNPYIVVSTPGVVYKNLLISGMRVGESADAAPGAIRAFDVLSGKVVWAFNTIPHPGEKGYETWPDKDAWKKLGGANCWGGMALDETTGVVYVPTGSVGGDFYGGMRKGQNLYGNSLVALNANTGKYIWHYQTIHHDLWDRDLPTNPNIINIKKDGKEIEAIAQVTKHGYVFLFDRKTGHPVFSIEEKPMPSSQLPGEETWPTQPIPTLPEPFARQVFDSGDVSDIDHETHIDMMEKYLKVEGKGMFAPPSKQGSWIFPGFDGGGEWGGAAVDPESAILYINSSELPWALTMIDVPKKSGDHSLKGIGKDIYGKYCISCHGAALKGNGSSFPALLNLKKRYNEAQVNAIITNGKNMMPAFKQIPDNEKRALLTFLLDIESKEGGEVSNRGKLRSPVNKKPGEPATVTAPNSIIDEIPFTMTGYNRFYDKNGYPGIKPPWGTLNAVDLNSGKLLWKVPLGEYPELTKRGIPITGTEGYGGPVVTKGGLVFIAASKDSKMRAFDKTTGKMLWEAALPASGFATPAVYAVNGKQYVVIACGGGKIGTKSDDKYVAFALPGKQ